MRARRARQARKRWSKPKLRKNEIKSQEEQTENQVES